MSAYDAIVLGAGGVGSGAAWALARRGARVLAVDQFAPVHDCGSSHGHTRLIRHAYFEHPDYVPLVLRAHSMWNELAELVGRRLFVETGLVEIGPAAGAVVPGVLRAAAAHQLAVESLEAADVERRWPALRAPGDLVGVFEQRAGCLFVEECVRAQLDAAQALGAELRFQERVVEWRIDGGDVVVRTATAAFRAARLIVTAGAWARDLLAPLGGNLVVRRKPLYWYATDDPQVRADAGFPAFLYELPHGVFYGFPALDERGLKAAEHSGGRVVHDPATLDRNVDDADRGRVDAFVAEHLLPPPLTLADHAACMYTMTPDEHFVVDRLPGCPQVVFAAGLSGHGFKFAPALGLALAELALDGRSSLPIEFLAHDRASLTGPS